MKVVRWLDKNFELVLMAVLLVVMTGIMFLQVIMRYVLNNSLSWAEEACRYLFVWFTCFSLGYCVAYKNHLRIDILDNIVPRMTKNTLAVISTVLQAFFAVMLIVGGPELIMRATRNGQTSISMHMPMQYLYVSLLVGAILMVIRIIETTVKSLIEMKKGGDAV